MSERSMASLFRAMAERVDAGENWRKVADDYGFLHVPYSQRGPVTDDAAARALVGEWWDSAGGVWPATPGTEVANDLERLIAAVATFAASEGAHAPSGVDAGATDVTPRCGHSRSAITPAACQHEDEECAWCEIARYEVYWARISKALDPDLPAGHLIGSRSGKSFVTLAVEAILASRAPARERSERDSSALAQVRAALAAAQEALLRAANGIQTLRECRCGGCVEVAAQAEIEARAALAASPGETRGAENTST